MGKINYSNMLHQETIFLDIDANNSDELFEQVASKLMNFGYVKNSYVRALKLREKEFSTGLQTKFLSIALSHVDPEHINKPFIATIINSKPIHMLQMGSNEDMKVKYFFFLGITDSSYQVVLLQKFMQLLQNKKFVDDLTNQTDQEIMYKFMTKEFLN